MLKYFDDMDTWNCWQLHSYVSDAQSNFKNKNDSPKRLVDSNDTSDIGDISEMSTSINERDTMVVILLMKISMDFGSMLLVVVYRYQPFIYTSCRWLLLELINWCHWWMLGTCSRRYATFPCSFLHQNPLIHHWSLSLSLIFIIIIVWVKYRSDEIKREPRLCTSHLPRSR